MNFFSKLRLVNKILPLVVALVAAIEDKRIHVDELDDIMAQLKPLLVELGLVQAD